MLKKLRFKSSVSFGTHILLDKSLRVLQLPTQLSNLTANGILFTLPYNSLFFLCYRV